MRQRLLGVVVAFLVTLIGAGVPAHAADNYTVDPMHSSVYFKISHLGLAPVFGRFNEFTGNFVLDPADASKCSFEMTIKAESIDTNNPKRDSHLRSPDFFNTKQFPAITFKSTSVKPIKDGYEVTGDLTMHGATKPVKFEVVGGRAAQFPPGTQRTGFAAELSVKRSEFGVGAEQFAKALGDEVRIAVGLEGTKR
ncbi:MAG TPA: YceI family protein [Gemmataceae bacterium]|nr:YceI family protein [Gemmataceae bacterium]